MGLINVPNTFSANTTIASSQVNSNFTTIYNEFNGNIAAANLASNAVTTAKIADDNVTAAKIADGAIDAAAKISAGVVASEKLGATIAVRAYRNAAFNVGSGPAKVSLDTENFDTGSDFASGTFTAPVTGYYQVNAVLSASNVDANGSLLCYIYVNGSAYAMNRDYSTSASDDLRVHVSTLAAVTAAQTIEMYQDCSTTETGSTGGTATWMSVHFVGV